MTLADILRRKGSSVITVDALTSVHHAVRMLVANNIGAVVALMDGTPVGILSERDLLHFVAQPRPDMESTRVGDVMTRELITASPKTCIDEAMSMMTIYRVRHLPIVADGELVGIVSIGDLVNALRRETELENGHLRNYIATAG